MCVHTVGTHERSAAFFAFIEHKKKFCFFVIDYGEKSVATMARTDLCEKRIEKKFGPRWTQDMTSNLDWLARIRYTLRCRSNGTSLVMHSQLEGIRRLSKQTDQTKQPHSHNNKPNGWTARTHIQRSNTKKQQQHRQQHNTRRLLSVVESLTGPHDTTEVMKKRWKYCRKQEQHQQQRPQRQH